MPTTRRGLARVQDNNGSGTGVLAADQTLQALVDEIVAAGGPQYSFIDVPPLVETNPTTRNTDPDNFGGVDNGNIRNAFLYDASRVQLVSFAGLTRAELASRGVSVSTAFDFSRDALEAVFRFRGEDIVLLNNHFSSRFGSSPVFGAVQPFVQAAEAAREARGSDTRDDDTGTRRRPLVGHPARHPLAAGDLVVTVSRR